MVTGTAARGVGSLVMAVVLWIAGCGTLPEPLPSAGRGDARLVSAERSRDGGPVARSALYDSARGGCPAATIQMLGRDDISRIRDDWSEDDGACVGAAKAALPATTTYPRGLLDAGVAGAAHLLVLIDRDGTVHDAHVVCATDRGFVAPALATAHTIRFAPASCAGRPVRATVLVPMEYSPE